MSTDKSVEIEIEQAAAEAIKLGFLVERIDEITGEKVWTITEKGRKEFDRLRKEQTGK